MTQEQLDKVAKQRLIFNEAVKAVHENNYRILPHQPFDPADVRASDMELLMNTGREQMISLVASRINEAKAA